MVRPLIEGYWRFRWFFWNWRERLTARWVLKYLGTHEAVYVHDKAGANRAVVLPSKVAEGYQVGEDRFLNHTHIEA